MSAGTRSAAARSYPFRDVTQFMLARAMALRAGTAPADAPLFCMARNKRRVLVCREAVLDL